MAVTAVLVALVAIWPTIPVGSSQVDLDMDGVRLQVFTYKPANYNGKRMIMVFHGVLRNADVYRDNSRGMGDRFAALIIAPKFDVERFPTRKYQYGGILDADRRPTKPSEWTYALIPKLAKAVRELEQRGGMEFWIIGHSAGGQFVARMSAFQETGAVRHVAANPGSHLFPTREMPFAYGFGGLPDELSSDDVLRRYLAAPLTIYLGTSDDKPDENFDGSETAMKQGAGRYQRGKACFELAKRLAAEKRWEFNWTLVEAEGVAHDHAKMFDHPMCAVALGLAK